VITVWEDRRQSVINVKLVGLYPLLMQGDDEHENPNSWASAGNFDSARIRFRRWPF
jgi:hypothetical protein